MVRWSSVLTVLTGGALAAGSGWISACGGAQSATLHGNGSGDGGNGSSGGTSGGSSGGSSGANAGGSGSSGGSSGGTQSSSGGTSTGSSSGMSSGGDGGVPCPPGLMCGVPCPGGATTSITGTVYDPAGKNPLYNVVAYVPAAPLQPLPAGVPTGADRCSCAALYKSGAVVSAITGVDGTFALTNVPVGSNVPLVLQVGKWRRSLSVPVTACQANAQADKSLTLPATVAAGSNDNMPDIAISTGSADTLECLMDRIGLPASEYVPGAGGSGHIHVFSGGDPTMNDPNVGTPESPAMMGAPQSNLSLWDSADHLMPYDVTLLSCEGAETYAANPAALETYLDAGGRVFASHYHYAWFAGAIGSNQGYTAPQDWGRNLASWMSDNSSAMGPIGGILGTTLNGSPQPFPKGLALQQWLKGVGALGMNAPAGELSIYDPRYNAVVGSSGPSQPWISSDSSGMSGQTMYFTFNTPVATPPGHPYCGRAVYSDLHVGADPMTTDDPNRPPPAKCANVELSPQEKALEFMLFDLSACVIPDSAAPSSPLP